METNVTEVFFQMREKQKANLLKAFGAEPMKKESSEQPDIIKALQSDNPFDRIVAQEELKKSNEYTEIEKSDILDAINYDSEIKIIKSGKEIKENIEKYVLPVRQALYDQKCREADELLKNCGDAPSMEPKPWMLRGINVTIPYKMYEWDETQYRSTDEETSCGGCICDNISVVGANQCKKNLPCDSEQAITRSRYNCAVEIICEAAVDVQALKLLINNIKDNQTFNLRPRQAMMFAFE